MDETPNAELEELMFLESTFGLFGFCQSGRHSQIARLALARLCGGSFNPGHTFESRFLRCFIYFLFSLLFLFSLSHIKLIHGHDYCRW